MSEVPLKTKDRSAGKVVDRDCKLLGESVTHLSFVRALQGYLANNKPPPPP